MNTISKLNFSKGSVTKTKKTGIITLHLSRGSTMQRDELEKSIIIFVLKGSTSLSTGNTVEKKISCGEMVLIAPQKNYKLCGLKKDTHLKILSFDASSRNVFNGGHSIMDLLPFLKNENNKHNELMVLKIHEQLSVCLTVTDIFIENGLEYEYLDELRKSEIFYLLFELYPPKELAAFFYPLLNENLQFKEFVLKNSLNVKNVAELAALFNYSTSGFIKRFKKYFNESPYKWMLKQRAENIFFELKKKDKTPKQIALEHHFSSYEHFIRFCKTQYGCTPTEVVKRK